MEPLRRSSLAVWNHYYHLYHSQETFQFWNLHLLPLKCWFENLNSDQNPKYFNFNLTDLCQCKLGLLQNKIYIKSFLSLRFHRVLLLVIEFVQEYRSIYLTYLNIQSFKVRMVIPPYWWMFFLYWVILCSLSTRYGHHRFPIQIRSSHSKWNVRDDRWCVPKFWTWSASCDFHLKNWRKQIPRSSILVAIFGNFKPVDIWLKTVKSCKLV